MARAWMPEVEQCRSNCRMRVRFRRYMDVPSKTPAPPHDPGGQGEGMDARGRAMQEQLPDARKARLRGVLSLGYFSLDKQREVTRPPLRGTKPCDNDAEGE
jgi:hypothetical protein